MGLNEMTADELWQWWLDNTPGGAIVKGNEESARNWQALPEEDRAKFTAQMEALMAKSKAIGESFRLGLRCVTKTRGELAEMYPERKWAAPTRR